MKRLPWMRTWFLAVLTLAGTMGMRYCLGLSVDSLQVTDNIWFFLLWTAAFSFVRGITAQDAWEKIRDFLNPCFLFGLCFSGAMWLGGQLDASGGVDFSDWQAYLSVLAAAAAASPLLGWVLYRLSLPGKQGRRPSGAEGRKRSFLLTWGILAVAYIPVLAASFPGFFTYDAEWTAYTVFTGHYSAHMPPLYVVLLGWTIRIVHRITHSYNAGIAGYLLVQLLTLSACFAYTIQVLRNIGVRRWICNLGTAFLALSPTVAMFVCCSTKEGYFAGGVLLLTASLLELAREGETFWNSRKKKAVLGAGALLVLFFRKEGVYALALFLFCFAIAYRRSWKRWIRTVLGISLIYAVTIFGVTKAFGFEKGELREMFSVPIQQLARTYQEAKDSFSQQDLETLYSLIPEVILEQYNPRLADSVKINFMEDNFKAEPVKYISLWGRTGLAHPDVYINAFLMNTYGYWYPNTWPKGYEGVHTGDVVYGDSSYFAFSTENPGERRHFFPALEDFYRKISLELSWQKIPVLSMLFSIGFWHWAFLFSVLVLYVRGYKKQIFALIPTGLLYLTALLGPIALVRYVLYLFYGVPVVLALIFDADTVAKTQHTAETAPQQMENQKGIQKGD